MLDPKALGLASSVFDFCSHHVLVVGAFRK